MKTVGIISEFNPFHNGHKYLIDTVKKELRAECVVAVMSGNYTQRGEIAIFDMYQRAEIACNNGVDVVFELPPQFVLNSAQYYALYGVSLFHNLGGIDYLCFGSECGDISALQSVIPQNITSAKEQMKSGITYAKAISDSDILRKPNNILGVEYLRALSNLGSTIQPYTVKRKSVEHDSDVTSGKFASASYLRKLLKNGNDVSEYVPAIPDSVPVNEEVLINFFRYRLLTATEEDVSKINNMSEGLENRLIKHRDKTSVEEMVNSIKCKRYPETRIRRALYSVLLNLHQSDELPCYTRVLALTKTGQQYIKSIKDSASVTIYSRISKKEIFQNPQLKKELYCNEIYSLAQELSNYGGDYGNYEHQKNDRRK